MGSRTTPPRKSQKLTSRALQNPRVFQPHSILRDTNPRAADLSHHVRVARPCSRGYHGSYGGRLRNIGRGGILYATFSQPNPRSHPLTCSPAHLLSSACSTARTGRL